MLKGLDGVGTHEHREWLPILDNTQDWAAAVPQVEAMLTEQPERARVPDPPAWALHLGPRPRRGKAARGDSGVSVRSDGAKARHDMATVRIPDEQRTLTDQDEVTRYLATLGIDYERWPTAERVPQQAAPRGSARRVRAGDRAAQGAAAATSPPT